MALLSRLGLAVALVSGCTGGDFLDPLHSAEVAALGPETAGVPEGPLHRPGQPCAACHGGDGPGKPQMVAAGTVYRDPLQTIAVADTVVVLIDAAGKTFMTTTNCVGNFYVKSSEFQPTPPMWTSVQLGEFPWKMESPIHREASCAKCHFDPVGPSSAGHLFVTDDETTFSSIPVRPCGSADGVSR
jgi:hypothetical protein